MTVKQTKHVSLPKWQIAIFWTATAIMAIAIGVLIFCTPLFEFIKSIKFL